MKPLVKTRFLMATVIITCICQTAAAQSPAELEVLKQAVLEMRKGIIGAIDKVQNLVKSRLDENYDQVHYYYDENRDQNLDADAKTAQVIPESTKLNNRLTGNIIGPNVVRNWDTILSSVIAGDSYSSAASAFEESVRDKAMSDSYCGANNFSLNSLLTPKTYMTKLLPCDAGLSNRFPHDQSRYASNFIYFVSNLDNPYPTVSIATLLNTGKLYDKDEASRLAGSFEYRDFLNTRRALVTTQASATSNLYYLHQLRQPVIQDGNVGPSAWERQYNIAMRRVSTPEWYTNMKAALPKVLLAEAVNILAEMQNNLMQYRLERQRLLATQSLIIIHDMQHDKKMMALKNTSIKGLVSRYKSGRGSAPGNSSGASSGSGSLQDQFNNNLTDEQRDKMNDSLTDEQRQQMNEALN